MSKLDKFKLSPTKIAGSLEEFWFRRFRWLYFTVYIPILSVLIFILWQNSIMQQDWNPERKQQYILESGQRGRDFQAETFAQIVDNVKRSEQIFTESASDTKNIFLSKE